MQKKKPRQCLALPEYRRNSFARLFCEAIVLFALISAEDKVGSRDSVDGPRLATAPKTGTPDRTAQKRPFAWCGVTNESWRRCLRSLVQEQDVNYLCRRLNGISPKSIPLQCLTPLFHLADEGTKVWAVASHIHPSIAPLHHFPPEPACGQGSPWAVMRCSPVACLHVIEKRETRFQVLTTRSFDHSVGCFTRPSSMADQCPSR